MSHQVERARSFLTDLFTGRPARHALSVMPQYPQSGLGDYTCSTLPVRNWVPTMMRQYEIMVRYAEELELDFVPFVNLSTNTGIFAAAFGCPLHVYGEGESAACAIPAVRTAAEADALPDPDFRNAPALARIMELGALMRDRLGPTVPIGVPDIQSPFDIAALVWKKEDFFAAMVESPEAVHRLVEKCRRLLSGFLHAFKKEFPNCNMAHCPATAWAPPELGCWLSEDEAGSVSPAMFADFILPSLIDMSQAFGGMFVHCCATADHQYANFMRIPNLRGLNRIFQYPPGPEPAIQTFSRETVLIQAWIGEPDVRAFLKIAQPDTRFFFQLSAMSIEEARPVLARLRETCGERRG